MEFLIDGVVLIKGKGQFSFERKELIIMYFKLRFIILSTFVFSILGCASRELNPELEAQLACQQKALGIDISPYLYKHDVCKTDKCVYDWDVIAAKCRYEVVTTHQKARLGSYSDPAYDYYYSSPKKMRRLLEVDKESAKCTRDSKLRHLKCAYDIGAEFLHSDPVCNKDAREYLLKCLENIDND